MRTPFGLTACIVLCGWGSAVLADAAAPLSHAPMRPLPAASDRPMDQGPSFFVDPARGADSNAGTEQSPWRSVKHASKQLQPGQTLILRGGTYYEPLALTRSGTPQAPITIRSHPGELAIIDGGLREFAESPATSWEPFEGGAAGEYVSTKAYPDVDGRVIPYHFLTAAWEPLVGIEDQRPLALGHFADSMVPLHGYRNVTDLRAENELWLGTKQEIVAIYCGPGLWYNRQTGRIHVRLAHHRLQGLGNHAYRGQTDPRKVPLVVALGYGQEVLRINGVQHVRVQDLVFRGATGSPMIHVYGSQNITLDHLTVFGGNPGLLVNAAQNIKVVHSAFRGLAAPWTSRAHMKYRGTPSYMIVFQNNQPENQDIEIANCEFTDDHDFAHVQYSRNLQFHHNLVDNFNDDGLEVGPKIADHSIFVYRNRIGAALITLTQHEIRKGESPAEHGPASGVYIFRNIVDTRSGVYRGPPQEADVTGAYLHHEGTLAGDHGGPTWAWIRFYHNTVLRHSPAWRNYFLMGLGAQGMRQTERDVFNNIFLQVQGPPGAAFGGMKQAEKLREGGNMIWSVEGGANVKGDLFAAARRSALFEQSKQHYPAGWTTHDVLADPKLVKLPQDKQDPVDLRLQPGSPAINAGVAVPADWPDPVRPSDDGAPDIGAIPAGGQSWPIGIDGRFSCFGEFIGNK